MRTPSLRRWLPVAAVVLLLPVAAFAQGVGGADLSADAGRVVTWAINLVRVIAALIILGGFLLFAVGRFHWAGGIVLIIGLIGAARAQQIASYFMGGA